MKKNNKTLQNILNKYQEIEMKLIEANGEVDDKLSELLVLNEMELSGKLDGYEKFVRYLKGQIAYLKEMEDLYVKRRKILENSVKKCKYAMVNAMQVTGNKKIKTDEFNFALGKTQKWSVDIEKINEISKKELIKEGCAENVFKINLGQVKTKYKESADETPDWVDIIENTFIRVT